MDKKFFIFLIFTGLIWLYACSNQQTDNREEENTQLREKTGEQLYLQFCISCHGKDGQLGFGDAANLKTSQLPKEEILRIVKEGKGSMTPFKGLISQYDMELIADFALELQQQQ